MGQNGAPERPLMDARNGAPGGARKFPPPPDHGAMNGAPVEIDHAEQRNIQRRALEQQRSGAGVALDTSEGMNADDPDSAKASAPAKGINFMERLKKHAETTTFNPLYGETKIAAKISSHPFFEPFCLATICTNALWIGYSTDAEDPDGADPPRMFRMVTYYYCFVFSVEILLRLASYRSPMNFFFDPVQRLWNVFDATLVAFMLGETFMLPMVAKGTELPALSALRLLRMLRMVRVLRMVPELAMMVRSLVAAIRSVSTTFVLAVGIMYIFSIILTQWAKEHEQINPCTPPACEEVLKTMSCTCVIDAFGSIPKSFLTLMQILCFDAAFSLIRAILEERIMYGLLLLVFIMIVAFTVLNMLIGVVCQIVASTNEKERSASTRQQVESLFRMMEIEQTGFISRKELKRNQHVREELDKVGVDEEIRKTSLKLISRKNNLTEEEEENGVLDLEELLEVVFKLLHPPQTQDILLVQSKLEKLERALDATGMSNAKKAKAEAKAAKDSAAQAAALFDSDEDHAEMDEATRLAVERSLWELETQVTSMLDHALETTGRKPKPAGITTWDVEMRRLDAAMCRLRVRLERCQDEVGPPMRGAEGAAADEAVRLASTELQYWRKLCGEVVQSISAASTLMAQAVREAEPDGMFRGSAENMFTGAAELGNVSGI